MKDYTMIFEAVIALIVAIISTFVIPWIREMRISYWVKVAVQAAEQVCKETGMGEKKKKEVIEFLEKHGITFDVEKIDKLIESAVFELNKGD